MAPGSCRPPLLHRQTFGNGPDPCVLDRADLGAYAAGRDARALELAVDFERRHCRA